MVTLYVNDKLFNLSFSSTSETYLSSTKGMGSGWNEGHTIVYILFDVGLLSQWRVSDLSGDYITLCTARD